MKRIKRGYYYLFYKFYRMSENAPSRWLSDWKAVLVIIALEIWFVLSITVYYATITRTKMELDITTPIVFIPFLSIILINYFAFVHTNVWKEYVSEFDKLPKRKNRIGGWLVFGIVMFVIFNLIYSFYLMSQIHWIQYR